MLQDKEVRLSVCPIICCVGSRWYMFVLMQAVCVCGYSARCNVFVWLLYLVEWVCVTVDVVLGGMCLFGCGSGWFVWTRYMTICACVDVALGVMGLFGCTSGCYVFVEAVCVYVDAVFSPIPAG